MATGVLSIAENGSIQVDTQHYCLSLKAKGSAVASTPHPVSDPAYTTRMRYVDIAYTSEDAPILAIRLPQASPIMVGGIVATTRVGNLWTFRVVVAGDQSQTFSFQYFIYDRPDWITSPGRGIAARDPVTLKPLFNSNNPVMLTRGQQSGEYGIGTYAFACVGVINYFHEVTDLTPTGHISTEKMEFTGAYCTSSGVYRVKKTIWGEVYSGITPPRFSPGAGLNGWGGGEVNGFINYDDSAFNVVDVANA